MSKKLPSEPAKNFNMNTVKKGQDKKTEYIVSKRSNGVKYWKILKSEEKKCLKEFEKKKKTNLEEYKKGKYVNNKQALAVTYSQVFKKNPKCEKYISSKKTKSQKKKVTKKSKK